jgi:hypothetical protein
MCRTGHDNMRVSPTSRLRRRSREADPVAARWWPRSAVVSAQRSEVSVYLSSPDDRVVPSFEDSVARERSLSCEIAKNQADPGGSTRPMLRNRASRCAASSAARTGASTKDLMARMGHDDMRAALIY